MKSESGQSTIEFALALILLFAFVLFFFQLSMAFAFGNYVHYATFMSARAYLSSGQDRSDQIARARDVIINMLKVQGSAGLDKFPSFGLGVGGGDPQGFQVDPPDNFIATDPHFSWLEGVRYTFRSRLFLIPMGGSNSQGKGSSAVNSITLTSESWLGRDPAVDECMKSIEGIYDNGC